MTQPKPPTPAWYDPQRIQWAGTPAGPRYPDPDPDDPREDLAAAGRTR